MKHLFIIVSVFALIPLNISAQKKFNAGLQMGLCASQIDGDLYAGYYKAGFVFGGYVNRVIKNKFSWQMEMRHIGKGATKKVDKYNVDVYKVKLQYLEVPLMLQFKLNRHLTFEGGFSAAYLYHQKVEIYNGGYTKDFSQTDISTLLGIKYSFWQRMAVSGRFSYSIIPIMDAGTNTGLYEPLNKYNNNIMIVLYYSFDKRTI